MKQSLPFFTGAICLLLVLNSCTVAKVTTNESIIENDSFGDETNCFAQMADGTIKNFTSLKLVTGLFKTPHLLADGVTVINPEDIKAYQTAKFYAVSVQDLEDSKKSLVAKEVLPGFAVRVAQGKLNVYCQKFYNGQNASKKYFLQQGEDGAIIAYAPEHLEKFVKDNKEAFSFFTKSDSKTDFAKILLATVEMYNNSGFISKN